MVTVVRYSFAGWHRRPAPEKLQAVRPSGRILYYTLTPEEGGEKVFAPVIEEVPLIDLFDRGEVWAADTWWANEATLGNSEAVKKYAASLVRLTNPKDLPWYTHVKTLYCWCGCGRVEDEYEVVTTEILVKPARPEGWNVRPWCPYRDRALEDEDPCVYGRCFGTCPWK